MRKFEGNIRDRLGGPLAGSAMVLLSIVAFIAALWVVMVLTRVVMG